MKIKEIKLFTNELSKNLFFYKEVLGFEIIKMNESSFSLQIGETRLIFEFSKDKYVYHYCFLVPSNQLKGALEWMRKRWEVLELEPGRFIEKFQDWNADAFYFYDGSGNIVEFIARYNLKNETEPPFTERQIINFNEIGTSTGDNSKISKQVQLEMDVDFYSGNQTRFCTHGNEEGLFLFPNYHTKEKWFPTDLSTNPSPYIATIEEKEKLFQVEFKNENMEIKQIL
jgi:catechol 2,3-dioxygenase-like lactoylglutathione lyase family enzyme